MKKVNWFKILLYLSLGFLAFGLYRADYLVIPTIYSYSKLSFSFILLFAGFISMCHNWQVVLENDKLATISFKDSIVSNGLSVFAKYIPGKLMVVLGRAIYVSQKYNVSIKTLSIASLKTQMITLWVGLLLGYLVALEIDLSLKILLPGLVFLIAFSVILFSKKLKTLIQKTIERIFKKSVDYPVLNVSRAIKVLPSFLLNWLLWCSAFYLLTISLVTYPIPYSSGFSFALAGTLAIIAIISPGGLGVREGLLLFCLLGFGINKQDAITISVASRLWFLIGEFFIFFTSLILSKSQKSVSA
jgi:uncharacterized membrane protein YbhN (UPF0104 family)